MKAAVFIDRDGILNSIQVVRGQPTTPVSMAEFHPNLWTLPLLDSLRTAGLLLIATTHQPGISSGSRFRPKVDSMHTKVRQALRTQYVFLCPTNEARGCNCLRPACG